MGRGHLVLVSYRIGKNPASDREKVVKMPVLYAQTNDSRAVYYPLGPYEQNPGWVKLNGARQLFLLESRLPIKGFHLKAFRAAPAAEGHGDRLVLAVNGHEFRSPVRGRFWEQELKVDHDKTRVLEDYRYELEFCSTRGPAWVVFSPVYGEGVVLPGQPHLSGRVLHVPDYSPSGRYSEDLKRFYFENGLDLTLLKSLNTRTILDNDTLSLKAVIPPFLLERGQYQMEFFFEAVGRDDSEDFTLPVETEILGRSGELKSTHSLGALNRVVALDVEDESVLCQIRFQVGCGKNYIVRRVILRPDYAAFLEKEWRRRTPRG